MALFASNPCFSYGFMARRSVSKIKAADSSQPQWLQEPSRTARFSEIIAFYQPRENSGHGYTNRITRGKGVDVIRLQGSKVRQLTRNLLHGKL